MALLVCAISFGASDVQADTIVSVTGGAPTSFFSLDTNWWLGVSFTIPQGYNNVTVSTSLISFNAPPLVGTAWLTNQVGPGTTASNVIASANFSNNFGFNSGNGSAISFFGSADLAPGTYYFLLSITSGIGEWGIFNPATLQTGPGVTVGETVFSSSGNHDAFAPASTWGTTGTFRSPLLITGTPVPEPSTLLLLGSGLAGLGALRRKGIL